MLYVHGHAHVCVCVVTYALHVCVYFTEKFKNVCAHSVHVCIRRYMHTYIHTYVHTYNARQMDRNLRSYTEEERTTKLARVAGWTFLGLQVSDLNVG